MRYKLFRYPEPAELEYCTEEIDIFKLVRNKVYFEGELLTKKTPGKLGEKIYLWVSISQEVFKKIIDENIHQKDKSDLLVDVKLENDFKVQLKKEFRYCSKFNLNKKSRYPELILFDKLSNEAIPIQLSDVVLPPIPNK